VQADDDDPGDAIPWFRRTRPDGSPEPHVTRGEEGRILIMDGGWAASFEHGRWHDGIRFSHDQIAEFTPVQKRRDIFRLLEEARQALGVKEA
jgi:hypothetical protein